MKLNFKQFLGVCLLATAGLAQADCSSLSGSSCGSTATNVDVSGVTCTAQEVNEMEYGQTFFSLRPQHSNTARYQMGTEGRIHQFAKQEFNGDLSLAIEWQQSTEADRLGSWFFFNGTNTMSYGPNWTPANYGEVDVNSLNFATTASGNITANPRVQNLIADLELYLGLDEFVEGLYVRFGVPVNYVRTDMRLVDTVTTAATSVFHWGDFSSNTTTADTVPYTNLATAWVGDKTVGDMVARTIGNINGRRSETSVAGLPIEIGYEFLRRESGHLGLGLLFVAPTGNTPNGNYLFEAVSGANGCWQVGGTVNGAYELWNNSDNSNLSVYLDAEITHLGRHNQKRILGLQNLRSGSTNGSTTPSAGASWIMLKKFTTSTNTYAGQLIPAANLLGLVTKIGNAVMGDVALSLKYRWDNYAVAVGYNFWGRSKETATAREESVFASTTVSYAIKEATGNTNATGNATTNMTSGASTTAATKAQSNISSMGTTVSDIGAATANYLTDADVTVCPTLHPAAMSNKVFGSFEYNWADNEWAPYLLVGGSYEIGSKTDGVKNSAVSQWGVLAKGGIAF